MKEDQMEEDQNGRQHKWKTTKMENDQNGYWEWILTKLKQFDKCIVLY